jgi:iron complex outermembrane receptor protein
VSSAGDTVALERALVRAGAAAQQTDSTGLAILRIPSGTWTVTVSRLGFRSDTIEVVVSASMDSTIVVILEEASEEIESVIVSATRGERRIEDEPLRVEVLSGEEVEEKLLMTPGDITMMLNETSGLRVQTTSPSLGGAAVRIQGLKGRYTQILADGLPLYGGQAGGLGLLQIPPMDLGGVEIIKGVASALYGGSALGGVINLLSRRPQDTPVRELLANQTTLGGTDIVGFESRQVSDALGYSMLLGAHRQSAVDSDDDGWTDLAAHRRIVVRPRGYWSNESGSNAMVTFGTTQEEREGGTVDDSNAPDGNPYPERLRTARWDAGGVGRLVSGAGIASVRGSISSQHHRHTFGAIQERDHHLTWFTEAAFTATQSMQSLVGGLSLQQERYTSRTVSRFDYVYSIPAAFAQLTRDLAGWLSVTGSARVDHHSEYGTFLSPRISGLVRLPAGWTIRASGGSGYYAPTPFTEETEAVGLSQVVPLSGLEAERATSASLDLGGMIRGVEVNGTVFRSVIRHPIAVREASVLVPSNVSQLLLENASAPTRTWGAEALMRWRLEPISVTATYTFVRSTEQNVMTGERQKSPLVPEHQLGLVTMFEEEGRTRAGVEVYYTGRQTLADNPFMSESKPYTHIGVLVERRVGHARFFVNAENLLDVRQTKHHPLVRPSRGAGGRWTTDSWAPAEGRVANAGIRIDL